ncbi:MAG: sarcosine oxidase subunit delta [Granulosicoccus sp.]|nr:sarcosine oxidase subunit delta [Granulosicoccus sp.]
MKLPHPLLGLRPVSEFIYLGDASLIQRPAGQDPSQLGDDATIDAFHDYVYLRDNPAGVHRELWFHEQGDRSWLVVTRNTVTHEITGCELARDVATAHHHARERQ